MNQNGTNDYGLDAEAWLVAIGDQPTPMTLDELDEAFRDGLIDEGTLVWAQGMPAWTPLGELASAPDGDTPLEALLGHSPERSEDSAPPMDDDDMPKVDPRLWNLSADDVRAARSFDMKPDDALDDETELGNEDLEEDDTPCGIPARVKASATFTPGLGSSSLPPLTRPTPSVPPRGGPSRVPPPPRARSLAPAAKAFESLPPIPAAAFESLPPIANITAFESTAPMTRTLSEPVIPIQPPPPGWNWRPWAAAAGMIVGLGAYGLSVLDLASSTPSAPPRAGVATIEPVPQGPASEAIGVGAARRAEVASVSSATPMTASVMPLAAQAAANDASGITAEPEPAAPPAASRKAKKAKKASTKSWKKKKRLAKSKTKAARSKPAAAAAAYKFLGMK